MGFIFHRSKLSSIGFYKCNQLNGLGRRFNNGEIEDGIFSDGKLSNILFRINTKRNQYRLYCWFDWANNSSKFLLIK